MHEFGNVAQDYGVEIGKRLAAISFGVELGPQELQLDRTADAIDRKTSEPGLQALGLPLRGFSAEALREVAVPTPSAVVADAPF